MIDKNFAEVKKSAKTKNKFSKQTWSRANFHLLEMCPVMQQSNLS